MLSKDGIWKLSDTGIIHKLDGKAIYSFEEHLKRPAEEGWWPNEIIEENWKRCLSTSVDIFSLGCCFYFALTQKHPFGEKTNNERLYNIQNMKSPSNDFLSKACSFSRTCDTILFVDLIKLMTHPDPTNRF